MKGSGTRLPMRGKEEKVKESQILKIDKPIRKQVVSAKPSRAKTSKPPSILNNSTRQKNATSSSATSPINFPASPSSKNAKQEFQNLLIEHEKIGENAEAMEIEILELKEVVKRACHERDTAISKLSRSSKEKSRSSGVYEDQIHQLKSQVRKLNRRVKLVSTIENALLELYVEVRDRSMDDLGAGHGNHNKEGRSPEEQQQIEKKKLLNDCDGDILVVLDHMRANLRIQLAFKEDYERELKGSLDRRQDVHANELKGMNRKIVRLQDKVKTFDDKAKLALNRMQKAEQGKRNITSEAKHMVEIAERKIQDLKAKLLEGENAQLEQERRLEEAWDRVRQAEKADKQIAQLQEKLHSQSIDNERALVRAETLHKMERERLSSQLRSSTNLKAKNEHLLETVKHLKLELSSYKQNLKLAKYTNAESKADHAEKAMLKAQHELAVLSDKHQKLRRLAEDRADQITEMKVGYNRMFKQKQKDAAAYRAETDGAAMVRKMSALEIKEAANNNPAYAQFYKKKLKASETRVKELTSMLKQFMQSDHKKKALLRSSRHATERYQIEMDGLKTQLQQSEKIRDKAELRLLNIQKQKNSGKRRRRPHSAAQVRRSKSSPFLDNIEPPPVGVTDSRSSVISYSVDTSVGGASKYEVDLLTPSFIGNDFGKTI